MAEDVDKASTFCEERRHLRPQNNAARERSRVRTLRSAFLELQRSLPAVPPNTKLSKLDILVLATAYIYHLTRTLEGQDHDLNKHGGTQGRSTFKSGHPTNSRINKTNGIMSMSISSRHLLLPTTKLTLSSVTQHVIRANRLKHHRNSTIAGKCSSSGHTHMSAHLDRTVKSFPPGPGYSSDIWQGRNFGLGTEMFPDSDCVAAPWQHLTDDNKSMGHSKWSPSHGTVEILHPVKKWPMRSRLYDSILGCSAESVSLTSSSSTSPTNCSTPISLSSSNKTDYK